MVHVLERYYYPPIIGGQIPYESCDIPTLYDPSDGFMHILKRTRKGTIWTRDIAVYVDGACKYSGTPFSSAGMGVHFGTGSLYNLSEPLLCGRLTSQRAEIQAAILALDQIEELILQGDLAAKTVVLVSDSKNVVDAMADFVEGWKCMNWRRPNGEPVKDARDFCILDNKIDWLEDEYEVYVQLWHVERRYNKEADLLAKKSLVFW